MSSFTFSSNPERKVLLSVALVLAATEVGTHVFSRGFSDVQHRNQIPAIASSLGNAPPPRILFLGNSLTRQGVSLKSFADQLRRHDVQVGGIFKVCPDDTTLRHWHYVFEGHFGNRFGGQAPDYVIVTFVRDHLSDQVDQRTRRMALNVAGMPQVVEVLCRDVRSLDEGAYFFAAHYLKAIAHQPEIKDGILRRLIPHYHAEIQRLNEMQRTCRAKNRVPGPTRPEEARFTYDQLEQFVSMLHENHCHGVFCLMPLPGEQSLDANLVKTIESRGMTFLDLRDLASHTEGHYSDGYHMDAVAADIYSRAVADALTERLEGTGACGE
ncbi:MAG: hypothetical protein RBS80_31195 [Thermoguttaceae bacterium]|jgi:hypothetical protein|nr:hypothetical protein [Thermoguttaceae bacterium]